MLSLPSALFSIAIFQGILLGVIVLRSPIFKSEANKYLAYAIIGLSLALLSLAAEVIETYETNLLIRIIDVFCSMALFPVLICLFIVNQVDHPFRHSAHRWWLFAPHVLTVAVSGVGTIVGYLYPSSWTLVLFEAAGGLLFLLVLVFIPWVVVYTYFFLKHAANRKEKRWLTQLWLWVTIIMISWVLSIVFAMLSLIDLATMMVTIGLGAIFLIHWITYVGVFRFRLSRDQEEIRAMIKKWKSGSVKPIIPRAAPSSEMDKKPTASLTKDNSYFKKLETLCLEERIYLDNTLDRIQVAEMLGISPGYVSQLVNTITGDNFSTYINRYRVEAVKEMIADEEFDNYSLLAIGLESGFSSKTTFHTAFKKLTGMTPNMYRKSHPIGSDS